MRFSSITAVLATSFVAYAAASPDGDVPDISISIGTLSSSPLPTGDIGARDNSNYLRVGQMKNRALGTFDNNTPSSSCTSATSSRTTGTGACTRPMGTGPSTSRPSGTGALPTGMSRPSGPIPQANTFSSIYTMPTVGVPRPTVQLPTGSSKPAGTSSLPTGTPRSSSASSTGIPPPSTLLK
ncbi:MAG: hypothetical protein M1813_008854 [Trichoglossum hirsutum]|nr:MAG: hypothetical protein M1813_008854 [Trichoglossum hirsutum]